MNDNLVSIDLAKNVFQVCVMNSDREILANKKVKRADLLDVLRQYPPTRVVMEACYSSNPWGRKIQALGHEVKLIPPFQVKPFIVGNKNDANDAVAIAEASLRPKTRFVEVKTLEQQDIQTVHRVQARCIRHPTATINQLRGLLSEYGVVVAKTRKVLQKAIPFILEDANNQLTLIARSMVSRLMNQWSALDEEIDELEKELGALTKQHKNYDLITSVPGVGPLGASLIIATAGDAKQFQNGRQFAAWLGLTPKQYASGEVNRMGAISKRGNLVLRKTLIHGARTVLNWCDRKDDALSLWLQKLKLKLHPSKVIVALANKIARIVWAVLNSRKAYDANLAAGNGA